MPAYMRALLSVSHRSFPSLDSPHFLFPLDERSSCGGYVLEWSKVEFSRHLHSSGIRVRSEIIPDLGDLRKCCDMRSLFCLTKQCWTFV